MFYFNLFYFGEEKKVLELEVYFVINKFKYYYLGFF